MKSMFFGEFDIAPAPETFELRLYFTICTKTDIFLEFATKILKKTAPLSARKAHERKGNEEKIFQQVLVYEVPRAHTHTYCILD